MTTTTDTPRTDVCPHCVAEEISAGEFECGSLDGEYRSERCRWRESMNKLGAEVERLLERAENAEDDLIRTQIEMQLEIDKAEAEVERLREQLESTKLLALKFWKVLEENGFKIELPK